MKKTLSEELKTYYIKEHNLMDIFDDKLLLGSQIFSFDKGDFIIRAGDYLDFYYIFVDGKIKVLNILENGKAILLKFYEDIDIIGDLEILKKSKLQCNIIAVEESYLIAIPIENILKYGFENKKFMEFTIISLANKLESTSNNSSYNLLYPLINRLCSYINEHSSKNNTIEFTSSFQEISEFLGTSYKHLNRTLKDLEKMNIIKRNGKKIIILDRLKLKSLSKNIYK